MQGNDNEITQKQEQAEKVLAEARQAAQKEIQDAKNEAQGQSDKRLNEVKSVRLLPTSLHACVLCCSVQSRRHPEGKSVTQGHRLSGNCLHCGKFGGAPNACKQGMPPQISVQADTAQYCTPGNRILSAVCVLRRKLTRS